MVKCSGISFRLFQEDLADDDWLAETMIKISDIEIQKAQSFWLKLDPKGELHVKIDLNRPMDSKGTALKFIQNFNRLIIIFNDCACFFESKQFFLLKRKYNLAP